MLRKNEIGSVKLFKIKIKSLDFSGKLEGGDF